MTVGAESDERDVRKVRIPADVLERFDNLVDAVRSRIMEAACRTARNRKKGPEVNRVTEEDILQSACVVLRRTVSDLDQELSQRHSQHVRIRHAS